MFMTARGIALLTVAWAAIVYSDPVSAEFVQQGVKLVGTGGRASIQGSAVAVSADGNTVIVGGRGDNNYAGAAWVWTRNGGVWRQQGAKLVATDAAGFAHQGGSVSISADGNTAIVGGVADGSHGAAYVWTRSGGTWKRQGGKLVGSGAVGDSRQGHSVALSADGETAIVGGVNDADGLGAVWIWRRNGAVWSQQGTKLVGSGGVGGANQGWAVALSADGNTAIVGGRSDDNYIGAVWIWTRSGGVWTQQGPKLVASASGFMEQGWSVSLSSDGNTALVGSPSAAGQIGGAWVWRRRGAIWTQDGGRLLGQGAAGSAQQGSSVALSADGGTAIVGARRDDGGTGAVFLWTRTNGKWTQNGPKLVGEPRGTDAELGWSVALSADGRTVVTGGHQDSGLNGAVWIFIEPSLKVGTPTVTPARTRTGASDFDVGGTFTDTSGVVGAPFTAKIDWGDGTTTNAAVNGFAYAFKGTHAYSETGTYHVRVSITSSHEHVTVRSPPTTISVGIQFGQYRTKLVATDAVGNFGDYQGSSVSLSGDGNTAIVGSPGTYNDRGAAWIWTWDGSKWTQGFMLVAADASRFTQLGASVALSGDGDTAIVGAPGFESGLGAAWVWTRRGGTWTQEARLTALDVSGPAQQGHSVAISSDGNTAIVGGYRDDENTGAAWVWRRSGTIWTRESGKLVGSGAVGKAEQGCSVAISSDGNIAVVGGRADNANAGATWVWIRNGGVWTEHGPKLVGSGAVTHAFQGYSVDLSNNGNTIVVGGPGDSDNTGAVWLWTRSGDAWTQFGPKLVGSNAVGRAQQGFSVAISADGTTAMAGANGDSGFFGAAWVWTKTADNWMQQGDKLVGSHAVYVAGLGQGSAVALSADGAIAMVAGPLDNFRGGAVWPWRRGGQTWSQQGEKLVVMPTLGIANQGRSVSLSGDGNTAIVGGEFDANGVGAAWVWDRNDYGDWVRDGDKLIGSAFSPGAFGVRQGTAVALSADGNTAIVGAPYANGTGTAVVWTRKDATWTEEARLTGSGAVNGADQGWSVALSADGNTAIVGGYFDNSFAGAAWIWTRSEGIWTQQGEKLVGSGAVGNSVQGIAVALSGDGNTAIIGGSGDDGSRGAVWVWTRSGGVWTQQGPKLVGTGAAGPFGSQGDSVALSYDGNTALVAGRSDMSDGQSFIGAAWVWRRSGGVWTQDGAKLVGSDVAHVAQESMSVALSADGNTALIGRAGDEDSTGGAWIWTRSGDVWTQQGAKLRAVDAVGLAGFGGSVCLSADGQTALVGGRYDNGGVGAAWVFVELHARRRSARH